MSSPNFLDYVVIAAGLAAIAWVVWYFFLSQPGAVSAQGGGRLQQVTVTVKGGYQPAHIRVRRGMPVRLIFDRQEHSSCSEEIVLPDFGIRRFLPAFKTTAVEFTPAEAGTFEFTCGMGMLRGKLSVEDPA
ncbi:MAG TPA: cupredoxin domain-containing protein [Gemmatimonadales bacterium]|nr:cupredoxin domain-containing protein [Gemmatimonadales bacterium]